jgi:hypothetical protein
MEYFSAAAHRRAATGSPVLECNAMADREKQPDANAHGNITGRDILSRFEAHQLS